MFHMCETSGNCADISMIELMKENAAEFDTQQDDVFGRMVSRYDFLCDLFSLGIHRLWKRRLAQVIVQQWKISLQPKSLPRNWTPSILQIFRLSD
jgi:hypothetical protein